MKVQELKERLAEIETLATELRGQIEDLSCDCHATWCEDDKEEDEDFWEEWENYLDQNAEIVGSLENALWEIKQGEKEITDIPTCKYL